MLRKVGVEEVAAVVDRGTRGTLKVRIGRVGRIGI
jgi:hypothetical protein